MRPGARRPLRGRPGARTSAERRPTCNRRLEDRRILAAIREIHRDSRETYGAPRVHAMLARGGIRVGRKRVARLMRAEGLTGLIKRRRGKTTIRVPGVATAPDLVRREWNPTEPNRLWVADITYCRTWEGWLYLAAVLDCHSRRCVGWSLRDDLRAELVVDAVAMAIARRRPRPGLVHHSDQGSQYVSLAMGEHLREAGIDVSMGERGSALDNAVVESFFSTLKRELVNRYPGRRRPTRGRRSSNGSRSSTTGRESTPPSAIMRPRSSRDSPSIN
jgi:putative transposase